MKTYRKQWVKVAEDQIILSFNNRVIAFDFASDQISDKYLICCHVFNNLIENSCRLLQNSQFFTCLIHAKKILLNALFCCFCNSVMSCWKKNKVLNVGK